MSIFSRENFAARLTQIRSALNLKQSNLSKSLECSEGALSFYERAQRFPPIPVLFNYCEKYGVSIDYVLGCFSPFPNIFSDRLKEVIAARNGKTLKEFAEVFGLDKATESLLTSGACFPNSKTLRNLCNYFNCSSDFLIGLSDTMEQSIGKMLPTDGILNCQIQRDPFENLTPDQVKHVTNLIKSFEEENAELIKADLTSTKEA